MQIQVQISFRGMEPSAAVEERIRERTERLERFHDGITRCHVTVQAPHQHHHKGRLFDVRIDLHVPGNEVVVTHEGSQNHAHEDVYVAIRDAFLVAERKLEELSRKAAPKRRARED
jgi:ribosomal subunit interface protein